MGGGGRRAVAAGKNPDGAGGAEWSEGSCLELQYPFLSARAGRSQPGLAQVGQPGIGACERRGWGWEYCTGRSTREEDDWCEGLEIAYAA